MDQGTSLKRRFASGCAPGASGEPKERLTKCGGVQGDQINWTDIPKTGWVTTRVTCNYWKQDNRDGMCLDRVAPRFQKSQGRRAANGDRPEALPRRCWPRSSALLL